MHLVHNERTKLLAGWLNALATAVIAAGILAPVAALLYGLATPGREALYLPILIAVCLGFGAALHFVGRAILGRLRE
jgi:hypothetical protein